jgi:hypothetical protein
MAFSQQVQSSAPLEFYRCERYEDVPSCSNAAILPTAPSGYQQRDLIPSQYRCQDKSEIRASLQASEFTHLVACPLLLGKINRPERFSLRHRSSARPAPETHMCAPRPGSAPQRRGGDVSSPECSRQS